MCVFISVCFLGRPYLLLLVFLVLATVSALFAWLSSHNVASCVYLYVFVELQYKTIH